MFCKTKRGKAKLCLDGYAYVLDKQIDAKYYWRCEAYKVCKGRLVTTCQSECHTVNSTKEHAHPPNAACAGVKRTLDQIQERAVETQESPAQIISVRY